MMNHHQPRITATHTKQDPKGRMPKQNPRTTEQNHCYVFALAACSLLERADEGTAVGLSHHQQRRTGNTPRANCQEAGTCASDECVLWAQELLTWMYIKNVHEAYVGGI